MKTIVTTSHKPDSEAVEMALTTALALNSEFVDRNRMSLEDLRRKYDTENIIVAANSILRLHTPQGEYFFHPSMSVPRIKAIRQGENDNMVDAMSLMPGDMVLDCTLGLGADAIVSGFVTGPAGIVVGIEAVPELALIVKQGLNNYVTESRVLRKAMDRISVECCPHEQYLDTLPENSFDVVYFDPMFRYPRTKSSSMAPLRGIVKYDPLTKHSIEEAIRVARKRVVMKENRFSREFKRLGFTNISGGKYSPVVFGIIDIQEAGL